MAGHAHTFVEKYAGTMCFGSSRPQDEAALICFLQKISDDQLMETLCPRMSAEDIELIVSLMTGIMKTFFSDAEYHSLFLNKASSPGQ